MQWKSPAKLLILVVALSTGNVVLAQSDSVSWLDEYAEAYHPKRESPVLSTPQWVGEEGVDAVVTLAIDDMRDTAKYEAYLRPILDRLKQIDGRAPVSIMTCNVDPQDKQLQTWLEEGLSIEVHTVDHPCPCLQGGNFATAKSTYDRCVDMMASIPGNVPVAFRTPCCDSRNTPSPRLWNEIFNQRTPGGNFLQADSSVFQVFTSADPALPRQLVTEPDGTPRFKKYIPFPSFVNTIENYPYPYLIGKLCWQFPCMVPSDWEAQNLHQPNNPKTVDDLKAALDATVIKQGMFNLVFHPHGWLRNDQVIDLIDYSHKRYGDRVKFLNFSECIGRINRHMLLGQSVRSSGGGDNGIRIVDLNDDGYLDVMIGNEAEMKSRIWQPSERRWHDSPSIIQFTDKNPAGRVDRGAKFGRLSPASGVSVLINNESESAVHHFSQAGWTKQVLPAPLDEISTSVGGIDQGVRLRDLDGDGISEILIGNPTQQQTLKRENDGSWSDQGPFPFPIVDTNGRDNGLRFVDLDQDGYDDVIVSNGRQRGIRLFDPESGLFAREAGKSADIPLIVRDGTNNGAWFAADHMWVQNENTSRLPDGVDRRSFQELLGDTEPGPRSPDLSLKSIKVRPGLSVELVAAEPLVMDPIAIDWGPDGKLWVVEMADYPLGMDDNGKPGGRVRYLEDTDGDGRYDKSTLFLDRIAFPTGVIAWRDGVLVSAAPTVFFAADRDGDGEADTREDLYQGFGEGNQQHRVNGFGRGLDNWIYLANGDSGGTIESLKTGERVDIRGRDLRIRPSDGAIDAQSGRTQFGRHRDDHGNWFGSSNPIPVRHYVLDDHYIRRNAMVRPPSMHRDIADGGNSQVFPISRVLSHWSGYKPPQPGSPHRFTSACSTMVYRDDLFGKDFQQNTFTCEPVHNAVHRRRLISEGVSFQSVRPSDESDFEFLASTDSWFRPTSVTTGPDGAIWVVDMYRLVIEHPEWIDDEREKQLFLRAGHDRGRIYRVYPTNNPPRPLESLLGLDAAELVRRLSSPNGRIRDLAQAVIVERNLKETTPLLEATLSSDASPMGRLHALCALDGIGELSIEALRTALSDAHPTVVRHAIRVAEPVLARDDHTASEVLQTLALCKIDDPHVRLQLAYSLGASRSPRATELLAQIAAESPDDVYLRAAVTSSLVEENALQFHDALEPADSAAAYHEALTQMAVKAKDNRLMTRMLAAALETISSGRPRSRTVESLRLLIPMVHARRLEIPHDLQSRIEELSARAVQVAFDVGADPTNRSLAVQLFVALGGDSRNLMRLVTTTEPLDVQVAAAEAVLPGNAAALFDRFGGLSPTVRTAVVDSALSRESTALQLVDAIKDDRISPQAIAMPNRQTIQTHASNKVREAAVGLFDENLPSTDKQELIDRYREASRIKGDPQSGQRVFTQHCSACHRVKEIGRNVGPDLAALKDRSPAALLTAVLDPNSAVEDKYRSYNVLTLSGFAAAGIITDESSTAIELQTNGGETKTFLREDIELIQGTGKSLMPEGLEHSISVSDMGHLLAFLNELGSRPGDARSETEDTSPGLTRE